MDADLSHEPFVLAAMTEAMNTLVEHEIDDIFISDEGEGE
jgi:hypothetical protein